MTRRWTLTVAMTALTGVVMGAAAVVAWQRLRPRLPAVAAAVATLDGAIATVVTAVGDSAAVAVTGLVPAMSCQKTALAKGSRYTRTANLYTDPGQENAVVDRVAAALPATERARVTTRTPGAVSALDADLGDGLHLQVLAVGTGWLAATAETDCRAGVPAQATSTNQSAVLAQSATRILSELSTSPLGFRTDTVSCPDGRITTLDAASGPTTTDNLPDRLAPSVPASARAFHSSSNRVAWRDQGRSTIVAASDDGTRITVQITTVAC